MSVDRHLLDASKHLLQAMDKVSDDALPEEISEIVKFHAKGAAAAALAGAWVPGLGGTIAVVTSAGFVWSMYGRIGDKLGLPFGSNVLKTLASGIATNLAAAFFGSLVLSTAFSFIPGLGSVGASVIMGATCYALTLGSGFVYLKIMTNLFESGIDPSTVSEENLKDMAAVAAKDGDIEDFFKHAKAEFKSKKKKGEFNN